METDHNDLAIAGTSGLTSYALAGTTAFMHIVLTECTENID